MPYEPGDRVLLVTDVPEGLLATAHEVSAVGPDGDGQLLTVDGRQLAVGSDGAGDSDGVSVLPMDAETARELYVRQSDSLVILPTLTDPYRISQDREGPADDLRIDGTAR